MFPYYLVLNIKTVLIISCSLCKAFAHAAGGAALKTAATREEGAAASRAPIASFLLNESLSAPSPSSPPFPAQAPPPVVLYAALKGREFDAGLRSAYVGSMHAARMMVPK